MSNHQDCVVLHSFFLYFFNIRRICYIAPERFKTRTITVEAATNPTLSTSIISDETPEADGEGDGELLPSMDIFSGENRVSVQGVKSLGGHFACLCRGFEFYEVKKKKLLLFFKKKMEILLHF